MDQLIIEQKIEALRRCLQRIAEKIPFSVPGPHTQQRGATPG
jgi:hypothetical protein